MILAADIGGTNSRFAIFADPNSEPEFQTVFSTNAFKTFAELLTELKQAHKEIQFAQIKSAVFAIAGPIIDSDSVNPPNIAWNILRPEISKILGINKTKLINDFQAQALAIVSMDQSSFKQIVKGKANESYPKAVIGAGTGFGKSLLVKTENDFYLSLASEGGHCDLVVVDKQEIKFREFAINKLKLDTLVWDDVVSGRGLEAIHEFLSGESLKAAEISARYLREQSETLKLFARFYGRAARLYVLDTMALGGLFIAGGVAAKNPLVVQSESFRSSFLQSKYHEILANIPITLVEADGSGLRGAAYEAFRISS